ncbi:uncharacterized protein METZ01_LOCUS300506, partial [marine metagenome]
MAVIGITKTNPSVPARSLRISAAVIPMLSNSTTGEANRLFLKSGARIAMRSSIRTPIYANNSVLTMVPKMSVPTFIPEEINCHDDICGFARRTSSIDGETSIAPSTATPNKPINIPA